MMRSVVSLTTNCSMKMKHKANSIQFKKYYLVLLINIVCVVSIEYFKMYPQWVEDIYAKQFYKLWTFVYMFLFSWVPFSVGDLFYAIVVLFILVLVYKIFSSIFRSNYQLAKCSSLQLCCILLTLYNLFYINWGLNYFRIPLAEKLGLKTQNISELEHEKVLYQYIDRINNIRDSLELSTKSKLGVRGDIVQFMYKDTLFDYTLSKSQIRIKEPLSSELVSYFSVSGYFNPFTMEAQINQAMPLASYPFVIVHELAHQMGIGLEDECNFIAFAKLQNHSNIWYRYAAYYAALQYLIAPYINNKDKMAIINARLSPAVLADFREERLFWSRYSGPIDILSGWFYNYFLKHNNQPEGMIRYSMMSRLVVAWEMRR